VQFQNHLTQLDFIEEASTLVKSICDKSFSFFAKLMAPVSQFLFCMLAVIFSLLHPSVIFVPLIPLMIFAFFSDLRKKPACSLFSVSKRLFILVAMTYTLAFYLYSLVSLYKNNSIMAKWRASKQENNYMWEVFGLSELSKISGGLAMRTLFPFHYEMLFIMALVTCSKYADIRAELL